MYSDDGTNAGTVHGEHLKVVSVIPYDFECGRYAYWLLVSHTNIRVVKDGRVWYTIWKTVHGYSNKRGMIQLDLDKVR